MSQKYGNKKAKEITILALFTAILIIQSFVPGLGYIPIGPLNATIVQVTVILGGILFDIKMGTTLGLIWGILSLLRAILTPNILTPVIINPLISVVPRVIVGLASAYIFKWLYKKLPISVSSIITGLIGSLLNTVLFLGAIYLFAGDSYATALGINPDVLLTTLFAVVISNGVPEAIVSGIITPLIVVPLSNRIKIEKNL